MEDVEKLLDKIEHDELSASWLSRLDGLSEHLPEELREKVMHFFNWNNSLLPELLYRIESAYTELPIWKHPGIDGLTWYDPPPGFDYTMLRATCWVHNVDQGLDGWPVYEEGLLILMELRKLELEKLSALFERALLYNSDFTDTLDPI